jgi:hypothetical protein
MRIFIEKKILPYYPLPITNYQLPSSQIAIYANNLNRVFGKFQAVKRDFYQLPKELQLESVYGLTLVD